MTAMVADIPQGLNHVEKSGSNDKRSALSAFKSLASGKNVENTCSQSQASNLILLNHNSIRIGMKRRRAIESGEDSWLAAKRRVRFDDIAEDVKHIVYEYQRDKASHPTGDKNEMVWCWVRKN